MAQHTLPDGATATIQSFSPSDGDDFVIGLFATLTIDQTFTSRLNIAGIDSQRIGNVEVSNNSTTNPLVINFGDNGNATVLIEENSVFKVRGDEISLGTSDGTAGQNFTLPAAIDGGACPKPTMLIVKNSDNSEHVYSCINSHKDENETLSDVYGNYEYGRFFYFNSASNRVEFGDGTNGYIPPNGAEIFMPNVIICANGGVVSWDMSPNGELDLEYCIFTHDAAGYHNGEMPGCAGAKMHYVGATFASDTSDRALEFVNFGGILDMLFSSVCVGGRSTFAVTSGTGDVNIRDSYIWACDDGGTENEECVLMDNMDNVRISRTTIHGKHEGILIQNCTDVAIEDMTYAGSAQLGYLLHMHASSNASISGHMKVSGFPFPGITTRATRAIGLTGAASSNKFELDFTVINSHASSFNNGSSYFLYTPQGSNNNSFDFLDSTVELGTNGIGTFLHSFGLGNALKNVIIDGNMTLPYIDFTSGSGSVEMINVRIINHLASSRRLEFVSGLKYNLVSLQNGYNIPQPLNPINDSSFHSFYPPGDLTEAIILFRPTNESSDSFITQTVGNGEFLIESRGRLYIEDIGDRLAFESSPFIGITGIESDAVNITGANTSNFTVRFRMKTADIGSYGAQREFTQANLATAFSELSENSTEIRDRGIVIEYEFEKTAGSYINDYIGDVEFRSTIQNNFTFVEYVEVSWTNMPQSTLDIIVVEELDSSGNPLSTPVYVDVASSSGKGTARLKKDTKYRYIADAIGYYRQDDWVEFTPSSISYFIVTLRRILDSNNNPRYGNGTAAVKALCVFDSSSNEMRITYDSSYPNIDYNSALDKIEEVTTSFAAIKLDLKQPNYQDGEIIFTSDSTVELADAPGNTGRPNLQFATYRAGQSNSNSLLRSPFHTSYGLNTKDTNVSVTDEGNIRSVNGSSVTSVDDFKATVSSDVNVTSIGGVSVSGPDDIGLTDEERIHLLSISTDSSEEQADVFLNRIY